MSWMSQSCFGNACCEQMTIELVLDTSTKGVFGEKKNFANY